MRRLLLTLSVLTLAALACTNPFAGSEEEISPEDVIATSLAQTEAANPPPTDTPTPEPSPTDTPTLTDTPVPSETPTPTEAASGSGGGAGSGGSGGSGSGGTTAGGSEEDCAPADVNAFTTAMAAVQQEMQADADLVIADPNILIDPIQGPQLAARAAARQAAINAAAPPGCLAGAQGQLQAAIEEQLAGIATAAAGGDLGAAAANFANSAQFLSEAGSLISAVTGG